MGNNSDLTRKITQDFLDGFLKEIKTGEYKGFVCSMVAEGYLPEGVDPEDRRVKSLIENCKKWKLFNKGDSKVKEFRTTIHGVWKGDENKTYSLLVWDNISAYLIPNKEIDPEIRDILEECHNNYANIEYDTLSDNMEKFVLMVGHPEVVLNSKYSEKYLNWLEKYQVSTEEYEKPINRPITVFYYTHLDY